MNLKFFRVGKIGSGGFKTRHIGPMAEFRLKVTAQDCTTRDEVTILLHESSASLRHENRLKCFQIYHEKYRLIVISMRTNAMQTNW